MTFVSGITCEDAHGVLQTLVAGKPAGAWEVQTQRKIIRIRVRWIARIGECVHQTIVARVGVFETSGPIFRLVCDKASMGLHYQRILIAVILATVGVLSDCVCEV